MFSYARYNVRLTKEELAEYGVSTDPRQLARLDGAEHVNTLIDLGTAFAKTNLKP